MPAALLLVSLAAVAACSGEDSAPARTRAPTSAPGATTSIAAGCETPPPTSPREKTIFDKLSKRASTLGDFRPSFAVSAGDVTAGASADLTYEITLPEGQPDFQAFFVTVPEAWRVTPGCALPLGEIVGELTWLTTLGIVSAFNTGIGDRRDDWICTSVAGYGSGSGLLPTGGPGTPGHPAAANGETLKPGYEQPDGLPPNPKYHIQSMTPCSISARMSVICVGDVIRLHTQYNNTSGFPITDAMGIMVMYLATPPNVPDANNNGTWDGCDTADSDGDGFSDRVEVSATTLANSRCGANAWPPDMDNSGYVDVIGDISMVASNFAAKVPPAPDRDDLAPNPTDGVIDVTGDISTMAGLFAQHC